jgi:undecaprenyl-diphosphatase
MSRLHARYPLGLTTRNWLLMLVLAGGLLRLAGLADATVSPALIHWPEPLHQVFATITDLGDATWILLPALILLLITSALAAVMRKRLPRLALVEMAGLYGFIFAGVGLPSFVANIAKRAIGRGRPVVFDAAGAFDYRWFAGDWRYEGFPSGHTTTIFAAAFVVGFLSPRWFPAMLVVAIAVGLSRIVVGMHYPTDVIGGAILGMVGAYLVRNAFARFGVVFRVQPDGQVVRRSFAATRRFTRRGPKAQLAAR